ncbi:chitin elicitor receptor kinase 1 [Tasmannia lanceolata]|uniref:chitin elicitor receptor kinase 1 n=1 Tax=Tasmannia lanceolata TaxID=3420 RepID=UPI004062A295
MMMIVLERRRRKVELYLLGFVIFLCVWVIGVQAQCRGGCDLALGSCYVSPNWNLTYISNLFDNRPISEIVLYNNISNQDSILAGTRVNVPFSCDCINENFFGHTFSYVVQSGDTYDQIASSVYANLTTTALLRAMNSYDETRIPDNATINVTVNCSCGDTSISKDYGLFVTYPLQPGENLSSVAADVGFRDLSLLRRYNPNSNFSSGEVFVPTKDLNGSYRPLKSSTGISGGVIAGLAVAGVAVVLFLFVCIYVVISRRKKSKKAALLPPSSGDNSIQQRHGSENILDKGTESVATVGGSLGLGITVDKSVEFSYDELSKATDDFSLANKIGQGGFGAVYYAELRGEKAAIKKMDMQASREFLAELKVLTHVHHLNLVRLIGFCTEGSLFLVYEFIENGNLSEHLRGSGREPLPWSARVQIALDSARGLEYIHEHTVPVYIHRDIKSANILIDKNFHGKVADFGLTKLTEVGSTSLPTRLVGTFGYMPPEYAQYGDVSPKVDVYAFGVVLYELISAKEAVVKTGGSIAESKGLVALFEEVLSKPDPREDLHKLADPRLGDSYPIDSVLKMAQLARACTQENPQLRPSMRSIVVALMTLSSSTEDWDVGSFYENQALVNLMSGR